MVGNTASFIGRLTKDPEIRQAGNNKVCNFTLARNRSNKSSNGHPQSDFVDCVAWNQAAELICKYFGKGSRIGVMGELRTRVYEDANNVKRKATEVFVNSIEFIDTRNGSNNNANANRVTEDTNNVVIETEVPADAYTADDELPF